MKKSNVKHKVDRVYSAPSLSPIVVEFQKLLRDVRGGFAWSQYLNDKEMRFVYELVGRAEENRKFTLTPAQSKWALQILSKIKNKTN